MADKKFSTQEAFQFGWDTLRDNFGFFIGLVVVVILATAIPGLIIRKLAVGAGLALAIPLQFLNYVWSAIIGMGVVRICLKFCDKQKVELTDLFECLPLTLNYVVAKILYALLVAVGLILLIIPGCIWAIQFYLCSYLVVDKGCGPIEALKESSAITQGAKWQLAVFGGWLLLVNILGAVALLIGLMITIPITMLASVYVYRQLAAQSNLVKTPPFLR